MILLNLTLLPQGMPLIRQGILSGSVWTTDDGKFHAYHLLDENTGIVHQGQIPKTQSGHRNPFHLLGNISEDVKKKLDN